MVERKCPVSIEQAMMDVQDYMAYLLEYELQTHGKNVVTVPMPLSFKEKYGYDVIHDEITDEWFIEVEEEVEES
jgi:predicted PilT family ATPase